MTPRNAATPAEMKRAKDNILNSFVFNFDTPEKVLGKKCQYEFYHYPLDFLERYRTEVEKVTSGYVDRVSNKYVHKEQLAVLVVGNDAEFDKPLSTLGPVANVDIAIPPGQPPASRMGGQGGGHICCSHHPTGAGELSSNGNLPLERQFDRSAAE